ncbi:MAG: hypothetical protein HKL80_07455 [Acidimicrobiales bacterium]|nr:hypothetical protein [Acidimicrobiales bacterium]
MSAWANGYIPRGQYATQDNNSLIPAKFGSKGRSFTTFICRFRSCKGAPAWASRGHSIFPILTAVLFASLLVGCTSNPPSDVVSSTVGVVVAPTMSQYDTQASKLCLAGFQTAMNDEQIGVKDSELYGSSSPSQNRALVNDLLRVAGAFITSINQLKALPSPPKTKTSIESAYREMDTVIQGFDSVRTQLLQVISPSEAAVLAALQDIERLSIHFSTIEGGWKGEIGVDCEIP